MLASRAFVLLVAALAFARLAQAWKVDSSLAQRKMGATPIARTEATGTPSRSPRFLQVSSQSEEVERTQRGGNPMWKEYDLFRHTYFRNVRTGEMQWTRPVDAQALPMGTLATLAAKDPDTYVRQDWIDSSKAFETKPHHRMEREVDKTDITLVFQGDVRRLQQLDAISHTWLGPISASLLLFESDIPQVDEMIKGSNSFRHNVDLNLCIAKQQWHYYPVNSLRNHAIKHAFRTDYVFIMDGDEDPVQAMRFFKSDLHAALDSTHADPLNSAFIVTSWQWGNSTPPDNEYPTTKLSISRLSTAGKAVCKGADFPQAYSPLGVSLATWLDSKSAKEVPWHDRYEPYMVVHKDTIGTFDERFVGWGGNKAIHILKMQLQHIKFFLLPNVFTFTNKSIADDNAGDHVLPADPDLPERAAEELGYQFGCGNCTYKECVRNCLKGIDIDDYV